MPRPAADPAPAAVPAAGGGRNGQLVFASVAVLLAAADAYVVVLALTSIMADLDISIDQLQQATPIISGFLVGYVAVLPLLGRLSDIYGRRPVFIACLIAFAAGSLVTASAHSLTTAVVGRSLQGLGGGGMVPVTLALVADLWPAERRAVPLGVVAGVQEFGSVLGPLYGAALISLWSWRLIFWINLPIALVLGIGLSLSSRGAARPPREGRFDIPGALLLGAAVICAAAAVVAPAPLTDNAVIGAVYGPVWGDSALLTPIALAALTATVAFCAWELVAPAAIRPLARLRALPRLVRAADWLGSLLLVLVLGAVVISFAAADPAQQVVSTEAAFLLPAAAVATLWFVMHERRSAAPLIRFSALRSPAAVGAVAANFFVGAGLMAAVVDVPIFARSTSSPDSQVGAALVLLRFLAAVPVGAVLGGFISRRTGYRAVAGGAMLVSAAMFVAMSRWNSAALDDPLFGVRWLHAADLTLVACGLGFGLAITPVNAAILAAVRAVWHGLASALVVVSRMVGMLVGLSVLTAAGLRQFHQLIGALPPVQSVCSGALGCPAYDALQQNALIGELHVIFIGAAIACAIAALIAVATLRHTPVEAAGDAA